VKVMLSIPRVNLISEAASDRELVNQDRIMVENLTATPHISNKGYDKMVELEAITIKEMMEMKKTKMIFMVKMKTTQQNNLIKTVKQEEHVVKVT